MKNKKITKRLVSMLLVLTMIFCAMPAMSLKVNAATSLLWPLPKSYTAISSGYGWRWGAFHRAYDIPAPSGTPIYASADGKIVQINTNANSARGLYVEIYHESKGVYIIYQHCSALNWNVIKKVGNYVHEGDVIAYVGNTGDSYGNHLHYEIGSKQNTYSNYLNPGNFQYYYTPQTNVKVITNAASNITNCSAIISGSLSSGSPTYWGFDFGTSQNNMTSYSYTGNSCDVQKFTGELKAGTTYFYRMWAVIGGAKKAGAIKSFVTTKVLPGTPILNISTKDIGLKDSIGASWSAASNAQYYKAYLYDENNNKLQEKKVTGNSVAFEGMETAGNYYVAVEAFNNAGASGASSSQMVTVHPDVKVSFLDHDGTKLCEDQMVGYGKSAAAPAAPSRVGYTFSKWDGDYTKVTSDIEIKAEYTINTYTVRFFDNNGKEIGAPQKVNYGSAAIAPDYKPEDGYALFGWDRDFSKITADTDVTANIDWYNKNYSVFAKIDSAKRIAEADKVENEGYEVVVTVTNNNDSTTRGRVVVVLETSEGKLVTTTESSAFSIQAGNKKEVTVFVPYDNYAKNAKVFVVSQYSSIVPIAEPVSAEIDQSKEWSSWSTERPPEGAYQTETRTEYRYKTKSVTTSYDTSMNGWTQDSSRWVQSGSGAIDYVSSWPSGFDRNSAIYRNYNKAPATAYENATNKRTVSTSTIGYVYYHWCRNDHVGTLNRMINYNWSREFHTFHAFVSGGRLGYNSRSDAFQCANAGVCNSTYWWNSSNPNSVPLYRCNYVDYRKQFTYYKWSDFSDWSPVVKTADENTAVETRTVYRYRTNETLQEDNSGEERTISGNIGKENANKKAALFIYKVNSASDFTNEYVGQGKIDAEGNYSFTFKLREEPTAETGDYTVALGIEGASSEIFLNPIEAPKKSYTVKFYDKDGKVISEQSVLEGKDAKLPEAESMQIDGYRFLNWTESNRNIREDMDIYPNYELKEYTVVFVDWTAKKVSMEKFKHGEVLLTPELGEVGEDQTIRWDVGENTVVKEDMIVTSVIEDKMVEVEIVGFNGESLGTEDVKYGDGVQLPEMDDNPNYIFLGWKAKEQQAEEVTSVMNAVVVRNITYYANYIYAETVELPYSNIKDGEYSEVQIVTLSCDTKGADIYYTVDGSDPSSSGTAVKYTEPIEVAKSCQLRYIAKCAGMNDSADISQFIAVNIGEEKYHILHIIAHTTMDDGSYIALVKNGYKINPADFADMNEGFSLGGFYTDEKMTKEFHPDTDSVNESMTLYLKYIPNTYTVTFKDEKGVVVKTESVPYGQEATPPEMTKEGYVFTGWDTDAYLCVKDDVVATAKYTLESEYARVRLNREKLSLTEGYQYRLTATVYPEALADKAVVWTSDNNNIATVENGVVKGEAPGETTITVTVVETRETASCTVLVLADTEKDVTEEVSGDVDGDGKITSDDALAVLMYVAGKNPQKFNLTSADCDSSPGVTSDDALWILMKVAGKV